ncbi:MAG: magnesium/cobalt transporter CorA [Deltaproteobacteria bacterium]
MSRFIRKSSEKIGKHPGALVYVGDRKVEKVRIRLINYDAATLREEQFNSIEEVFNCRNTAAVSWINIDGLHDVEVIEKIGGHFNLHPLLLEDVLNTEQRPKIEDYGHCLFIVLKMLEYNDKKERIEAEQMSLVLMPSVVITFQENYGDVFNPLRGRIKNFKGRVRAAGADYLAYALMDAIVDNYFVILERIGDKIEEIEGELLSNPTERTLAKLQKMRKEMLLLRKFVWPLREIVSALQREEFSLIDKASAAYIRDLYDHTIQVIDTIEALRDVLSGMVDIYLSSTGNRMNEVMKVLTIISTIFIPLTFVAGVYGMNFRYMPELSERWGYPAVLGIMLAAGCAMLLYFRRKKWL